MENITQKNLLLIDETCRKQNVQYELVSVSTGLPGEALIDLGDSFKRKVINHELQKQGFFVAQFNEKTPSLLTVFLATRKDLFSAKKGPQLFSVKMIISLINFLLENTLNISGITSSITANEINEFTKVFSFSGTKGDISTLWEKINFLGITKLMAIVPFKTDLHILLNQEAEKRVWLMTRRKYQEIIDFTQEITDYVFVLPKTLGGRTLRMNLGNEEKLIRALPKLEQQFPQYSFDYLLTGNRILSVNGVFQESYRAIYQKPAPFSVEDFLNKNTGKIPSIKEVLDILFANVTIYSIDKHPKTLKSRKNNMFLGFKDEKEGILARKILTSQGINFEEGKTLRTVKVPVIEEFGLFKKDIVSTDPRKKYIEKKFSYSA